MVNAVNTRYQYFSQFLTEAVEEARKTILFDWDREDLFEIGKTFVTALTSQFNCECSIEKDSASWNYSIKLFTRQREVAARWGVSRSESGYTVTLRWGCGVDPLTQEHHNLGPAGLVRAFRASLLNDEMLTILSKFVRYENT